MGSVAGMATTFTLPNYGGELYLATPTDTRFLSAIGGLAIDDPDSIVAATEINWQTEDLAAAAQPAILEGAAPTMEERTRSNVSNVLQIFQYGVEVSYTKLAAQAQLNHNGNGQNNPVQNELTHQTMLKLKTAARDINFSFLRGAYQKPVDNTTARKTRGLIAAITTNTVAAAAATLTEDMVNTLMKAVFASRGAHQDQEPTFIVNSHQKLQLTKIYITNKGFQQVQRNVGGVAVETIVTEWGTFNVMLERDMPADTLVFCHLRQCKPKFMLIPDKGFLFLEPLGKVGASEKWQLYGEVGLHYGDEGAHGKITGLATS